jgi:hypothetical protein
VTDLTNLESRWHVLNEHLAWAPLDVPPQPEDLPLYEIPFSAFILVRCKSDSPTGEAFRNHILGVLRCDPDRIEGLGIDTNERLDIPADFRFVLLRTNAEVPANPIHHLMAFGVNEPAKLVAGFEYKQDESG